MVYLSVSTARYANVLLCRQEHPLVKVVHTWPDIEQHVMDVIRQRSGEPAQQHRALIEPLGVFSV
jgi:hypothetical protein